MLKISTTGWWSSLPRLTQAILSYPMYLPLPLAILYLTHEEDASNQRQKKREAEEADKVEVASGVTVASLRRFEPRSLDQSKDSLSDVDCAVSEN